MAAGYRVVAAPCALLHSLGQWLKEDLELELEHWEVELLVAAEAHWALAAQALRQHLLKWQKKEPPLLAWKQTEAYSLAHHSEDE